ncbi:MAG: hypothetical protein QHH06_09040 [Clostridiales bacterium]|jgi:hypothetical protein|nr:hypothetical protein [Eubacteriales bacterium]MDH7566611.1 hypothetical protein [Clostridiales bacterium]
MIKIIYGKKGMGKTKILVDEANKHGAGGSGNVVFIDYHNQLMYDLKHEVRFINVSEFPVRNAEAFLGFICGIISANYDVNGIFIDGLTYILKQDIESLQPFFMKLEEVSKKFNMEFHISINGDPDLCPDYIKGYLV